MPLQAVEYVYQVFNGAEFVGVLQNVTSPFGYVQNLNTAAAQLDIEIGTAFRDLGASNDADFLVNELGDFIIDERGNNIVTRSDLIFTNAPIAMGYRVKVYEYSEHHPNGRLCFDGFMARWSADYKQDVTKVVVLSHGTRMSHYLIDTASDVNVEQDEWNTTRTLGPASAGADEDRAAQTFQLAVASSVVSFEVMVKMSSAGGTVFMRWALVEGTPLAPGATLATGTVFPSSLTEEFFLITLPSPVDLLDATDYYIEVWNSGSPTSSYRSPVIHYQNSSVYASGAYYENIDGAGWGAVTGDMAFRINTTSGSVGGAFTDTDPSDMIRTAMDLFASRGGLVTYDSSTLEDTGLSLTYSFKLGTILEAVEKGNDLSPGNWFWYVDPATSKLHFKRRSTDPDHVFALSELTEFSIEQRVDDMINAVYFSGGDDGSGDNVFVFDTNPVSVSRYGQWLTRRSDNRVTLEDTADAIVSGELARVPNPPFEVFIELPVTFYDTSTVSLGQVIGFKDFDNFVDDLRLQVVSIQPGPEVIRLTLGTLKPRISSEIERQEQRLIALETIDNPDAPS